MTNIKTYTIDIDKAREYGKKGGEKTAKLGIKHYKKMGKKSAELRKLRAKCECDKV